jgi:hypothetical protein
VSIVSSLSFIREGLVREEGLEPSRVTPRDPKSRASANSATPADPATGTLAHFSRYFFIQENTTSCQRLLLRGLSTQWPSSGNTSASAGTPLPRRAVSI